jgi:hypothetical protein
MPVSPSIPGKIIIEKARIFRAFILVIFFHDSNVHTPIPPHFLTVSF